eukprot:673042-Hanusia_phi.AAC.4
MDDNPVNTIDDLCNVRSGFCASLGPSHDMDRAKFLIDDANVWQQQRLSRTEGTRVGDKLQKSLRV